MKHYVDADIDLEAEKATKLEQVLAGFGRAATPRPLRVDRADKAITFNYLASDRSLAQMFVEHMGSGSARPGFLKLIALAGELLGYIHQKLALSSSSQWSPGESFDRGAEAAGIDADTMMRKLRESPQAFLHGDYGFPNFEVVEGAEPHLNLYDPSPNGHTTFTADLQASIYLDLGAFIGGLNGRVPLRFHPWMRWGRLAEVKWVFLDAYARQTNYRPQADLVEQIGYLTNYASFTKHRGDGFLRDCALAVLYNRFKGNTDWRSRQNARNRFAS